MCGDGLPTVLAPDAQLDECSSYARSVAPYDDDDDWVGTPPEGRYTRDRANPEFWWKQRPIGIGAAGLVVVVIIVLVIALTR